MDFTQHARLIFTIGLIEGRPGDGILRLQGQMKFLQPREIPHQEGLLLGSAHWKTMPHRMTEILANDDQDMVGRLVDEIFQSASGQVQKLFIQNEDPLGLTTLPHSFERGILENPLHRGLNRNLLDCLYVTPTVCPQSGGR